MNEREHHADEPRPSYEKRDISIHYLVIFGIVLVACVAATLWGTKIAFHFMEKYTGLGPPATPFAVKRQLPPGPRLEVNPRQHLEKYLAQQKKKLDSYGWVNRKKGIARIPINQAMSIMLQKGFPVRSPSELKEQGKLEPGTVQQYTVPTGYTPH